MLAAQKKYLREVDAGKHGKPVLIALSLFENTNHDPVWPSVKTLANITGRSERQTQYALRSLEEHALILTLRSTDGRSANRYKIRWPAWTLEKGKTTQKTGTNGPRGSTRARSLVEDLSDRSWAE